MSKFTPGPWHWDSDPIKGDPLDRVRYQVTTVGKTITKCYYSSQDEQAEWDARLIAAAPDLLEALEKIAALEDTEKNEWDAVERVLPEAIAIARAAIKKAVQP